MTPPKILVAGIGNIFLGDDAFGVEVVRRLADKELPEGVEVVDFGIKGLDLTYALLAGYQTVILVDAVPRGGPPGTLYTIEPEAEEIVPGDPCEMLVESHSLDPAKVLRLARRLGGRVERLLLVGCEPAPLDAEEMCDGLSEAVAGSVDEAVNIVQNLIAETYQPTGA